MQITLSQEQTHVLEALVKYGQYSSLEEALNTALLLLIDDVALSKVTVDRPDKTKLWYCRKDELTISPETVGAQRLAPDSIVTSNPSF